MSDTEDTQVQQQLERYHKVAQDLKSSTNPDQIEVVLEPITQLPQDSQVAFLKALGRENTVEAADVALAINTMSEDKAIRKEARRTLIRLENADTYPEWSPTAPTTLGQALDASSSDALLSELQSLVSGVKGFFSGPEYMDVVAGFIEDWSTEDYEEAYEKLASTSPLREGLAREAWVERREQWSEQAQIEDYQVSFLNEITDEQHPELRPRVEVGWSLSYTETPAADQLKELPVATAVFKETGRHWFWSSYTLVEENGEWHIDTMIDEGAHALQMPQDELQQHIDEIVAFASQILAEEEEFEDEEDEVGVVEDEADTEEVIDEDEEEEDEDEEEGGIGDETFEETLQHMDEAIRMTTKGMHYNDALIAQAPKRSAEVYQQAYAQAMAVNEPDRAVVYLQQLAEHFPEQRGVALRELSLALNRYVETQLDEEEDEELLERLGELEENALRDSIVADNAAAGYIMLADLLIDNEERIDEAEELLDKAQKLTSDEQEITLIEAGLAEIAQIREEPEEALKHYLKVADLSPDYPDIWLQIGSLYHQLHRHEEAIVNLRRSIKTSPSQTGAYAELGTIYAEREELPRAREILKQGLDISPEAADLLAILSLTYIQGGDLRNAEKYLQEAEEVDDEHELVQTARLIFDQQKAQLRSGPRFTAKQKAKKKKKK